MRCSIVPLRARHLRDSVRGARAAVRVRAAARHAGRRVPGEAGVHAAADRVRRTSHEEGRVSTVAVACEQSTYYCMV